MPNIEPELRRLHSPDVLELEHFGPNGPFGILVQALIGPRGSVGEESFDMVVCTPEWFSSRFTAIADGRHHLFVHTFDFHALETYIRNYCSSCGDASWPLVAQKLSRLGKWEFEDYTP